MLEDFQGSRIELINQGIGSKVLTPECPVYPHSAKPAALSHLALPASYCLRINGA
jgi:hypothetical protein